MMGMLVMKCPDEKKIEMYLNGVLPEREAREIAAHIGECGRCSAVYESLVMVDRSVRQCEPDLPGEEYWETLAARLKAGRSETHGSAAPRPVVRRVVCAALEVAAAVIILVSAVAFSAMNPKNFSALNPRIGDYAALEQSPENRAADVMRPGTRGGSFLINKSRMPDQDY